jgi:competence protein ComEA
MKQSPNEQHALRALALVLAAGVGVWYGTQRSAPEWRVEAELAVAEGRGGAAPLAARAEEENTRARRRALPLQPGERIDPNSADADELQRLPRVGPSLAARIVAHREANGPYRSLADLDAVAGIGPAVLDGIAPHLALPSAPRRPAQGGNRAAAPTPSSASSASSDRPLDLNSASAEELQRLPGVGPVIAERIVAWRREHGRFDSPDDLARVPGIGPRSAERLRPMVRATP